MLLSCLLFPENVTSFRSLRGSCVSCPLIHSPSFCCLSCRNSRPANASLSTHPSQKSQQTVSSSGGGKSHQSFSWKRCGKFKSKFCNFPLLRILYFLTHFVSGKFDVCSTSHIKYSTRFRTNSTFFSMCDMFFS